MEESLIVFLCCHFGKGQIIGTYTTYIGIPRQYRVNVAEFGKIFKISGYHH